MNIIVFGAADSTGRVLTEQALAGGHIVTGFARNSYALKLQHPNLKMIKGDIFVPPSRLTDTPRTGVYRAGEHLYISPGAHIARADVADFMLKQVGHDTYIHKTPRLKY